MHSKLWSTAILNLTEVKCTTTRIFRICLFYLPMFLALAKTSGTPSILSVWSFLSTLNYWWILCILILIFSGALHIKNSEEKDQGKYECVAENSVGTEYSKPAQLYVRGKLLLQFYVCSDFFASLFQYVVFHRSSPSLRHLWVKLCWVQTLIWHVLPWVRQCLLLSGEKDLFRS